MGRFLIGFLIGLLVGAAVVIIAGPRSGQPKAIGEIVDGALKAARRASDLKQQEMWSDYRTRIQPIAKPASQNPWEQ